MAERERSAPTYEYIKIEEGLELLALDIGSAEALFDATDRSREYLAKYLPWVNDTTSVEDSRAFIESVQEKRASGEEYGFGIILGGQVVGHISLMHVKGENGKIPEIGYWITESASGKGVTTKVARAVTQLGLKELQLDLILIRAAADNTASNWIARSLGYYKDEIQADEDGALTNYWLKERSSSDF